MSRWQDPQWVPYGTFDGEALTMTVQDSRTVFVGGQFQTVDGNDSEYYSTLTNSCSAVAAAVGLNCSTPGNDPQLDASALPWLGSTIDLNGTGLPDPSIVLTVLGAPGSVLFLNTVLPAPANCLLLHGADVIVPVVGNNGAATFSLTVPSPQSLAGLRANCTMVPLSLGATGNIVGATMTNGVALTLGYF